MDQNGKLQISETVWEPACTRNPFAIKNRSSETAAKPHVGTENQVECPCLGTVVEFNAVFFGAQRLFIHLIYKSLKQVWKNRYHVQYVDFLEIYVSPLFSIDDNVFYKCICIYIYKTWYIISYIIP